jgi:two-component system nitrogen regulation response regulator GlnG
VPELARHFFARCESEGLTPKSLDADAMSFLKSYRWPGNVRELENLIRRLSALYTQEVIDLGILQSELGDAPAEPRPTAEGPPAGESLGSAVERHLRDYFEAHEDGLPASGLYDRVVREVERPLIELSLAATKGNQLRAAKLLGLNRNTLRKKIRDLEIDVVRGLK